MNKKNENIVFDGYLCEIYRLKKIIKCNYFLKRV